MTQAAGLILFLQPGSIVAFFRWEPALGLAGSEALRQGFMTAKPIHEALGAKVESYQVNRGCKGHDVFDDI